ncbi:MAG: nuclear transport factor 2 family protein [Planctomycetota bacterium]|jgi:ketosteroid isomerase-like protein
MNAKNMRLIAKTILVLICVSAMWAAGNDKCDKSSEQQQAIEKAILEVHEEMKTAAQKLDIETLYGYVLDSKGPIIEDGRLRQTRQEALELTRQGFQGITNLSYTYNNKNITMISPTAALWVAEGTSSLTIEDGRNFSAAFAETIIFTLRDGQWKVLHAHRSIPNER